MARLTFKPKKGRRLDAGSKQNRSLEMHQREFNRQVFLLVRHWKDSPSWLETIHCGNMPMPVVRAIVEQAVTEAQRTGVAHPIGIELVGGEA